MVVELEENLRRNVGDVFVEKVFNEQNCSPVVPMSMDQKGAPQVLESRHCKVGANNRLAPFFTHDTLN